MMCLARLVRAIFGDGAVAKHKLDFGQSLVALGVLITPKEYSFRCELAPAKAAKCVDTIVKALTSCEMYPGTARKLSGRLSWASQFMFRRLGRAMLRPLFQRAHSSECMLDEPLRVALGWWLEVLKKGVAEEYPWQLEADRPAHLYVDARGVPPRFVACALSRLLFVVHRVAGVRPCYLLTAVCITRMANQRVLSWSSSNRGVITRSRLLKFWQSRLGCPVLHICYVAADVSYFLTTAALRAALLKVLHELGTNVC